jgi:hypothetical protein
LLFTDDNDLLAGATENENDVTREDFFRRPFFKISLRLTLLLQR